MMKYLGVAVLLLTVAQSAALGGYSRRDVQGVYRTNKVGDDVQCQNCKKYMGKLYDLIASDLKKLEPDIVSIVDKVCMTSAGKDSGFCKQALNDFPTFLILQLRGIFNPYQFCPASGYCPKATEGSTVPDDSVNGKVKDDCSDCQTFLTDSQKKIVNNGQLDVNIVNTFNAACDSYCVLGPFCRKALQQYFPIMLKKLMQLLEPDDRHLCGLMGFCSTSAVNEPEAKISGLIAKLTETQRPPETMETAPSCDTCKDVTGRVYTKLDINLDQYAPQIDAKISEVCGQAGNLSNLCKEALKDLPVRMAERLVYILNPYYFCPEAGYCPQNYQPVDEGPKYQAVTCDSCKALIPDILARIKTDEGGVNKKLSQHMADSCVALCSLADMCKQVVLSLMEPMLKALASTTLPSPLDACIKIKYCEADGRADSTKGGSYRSAQPSKIVDAGMMKDFANL